MPEVQTHPSANDVVDETRKATSGRRGGRQGVEIKPGTAKRARLEAGLSLGQVAGNDISRTAIYFVETGKAKPSMDTLKLIAARTGRALDRRLGRDRAFDHRGGRGRCPCRRLGGARGRAGP